MFKTINVFLAQLRYLAWMANMNDHNLDVNYNFTALGQYWFIFDTFSETNIATCYGQVVARHSLRRSSIFGRARSPRRFQASLVGHVGLAQWTPATEHVWGGVLRFLRPAWLSDVSDVIQGWVTKNVSFIVYIFT
jgi:hypothetical protein